MSTPLIPISLLFHELGAHIDARVNTNEAWQYALSKCGVDMVTDQIGLACITAEDAQRLIAERDQRKAEYAARQAAKPKTQNQIEHEAMLQRIGEDMKRRQRRSEMLSRIANEPDAALEAWEAHMDARREDVDVYQPISGLDGMWESQADANAALRFGGGL